MGGLTRLFGGGGLDALVDDSYTPSPLMDDKLREQLAQEKRQRDEQDQAIQATQQVAQPSNSWMQAASGAHSQDNSNILNDVYNQSPLPSTAHLFNNVMHAIDTPWENAKNNLSSFLAQSPGPDYDESYPNPTQAEKPQDIPVSTSVGPGTVNSTPQHEQDLAIGNFLKNSKQGQDEEIAKGLFGEPESTDSAGRKLGRSATQLGVGLGTRPSNLVPLGPGHLPDLRKISPVLDVFANAGATAGGLGAIASGLDSTRNNLPEFVKDPSIESGTNLVTGALPTLLSLHSLGELARGGGIEGGVAGDYVRPEAQGNETQIPGQEKWLGPPVEDTPIDLNNVNPNWKPTPENSPELFSGGEAGAVGSILGKQADEGNKRAQPFAESKLPFEQPVKVVFPDGEIHYDSIKGLNQAHALARARSNWDGATVEPVDVYKPNSETGAIGNVGEVKNKVKNLGPVPEEKGQELDPFGGSGESDQDFRNRMMGIGNKGLDQQSLDALTRHPAVSHALDDLAETHGTTNPQRLASGYFHDVFSTDNPDTVIRASTKPYEVGDTPVDWPDSKYVIQPKESRFVGGKQIDVLPALKKIVRPTPEQVDALKAELAKEGKYELVDPEGSGGNLAVIGGKARVVDPGALAPIGVNKAYEAASGVRTPEAFRARQQMQDYVRRSGREGGKNPILGNFDRSSERGSIGSEEPSGNLENQFSSKLEDIEEPYKPNLTEVYHGSPGEGDFQGSTLKRSPDGFYGKGTYYTDNKDTANHFATELSARENQEGSRVYKKTLDPQKPLNIAEGKLPTDFKLAANKILGKTHDWTSTSGASILDQFRKKLGPDGTQRLLNDLGYDTIIGGGTKHGEKYYVDIKKSELGAIGNLDKIPGYASNADEVMKDLEERGLGDFIPRDVKAKRILAGEQGLNQNKPPVKVDQLFDPTTGEDLSDLPKQQLPDFPKSPEEMISESLNKIRGESKTAQTPQAKEPFKPSGIYPKKSAGGGGELPPKPPSKPPADSNPAETPLEPSKPYIGKNSPLLHATADLVSATKRTIMTTGIPGTAINPHGYSTVIRAGLGSDFGKDLPHAAKYAIFPSEAEASLKANAGEIERLTGGTKDSPTSGLLQIKNIEDYPDDTSKTGPMKTVRQIHNDWFEKPLFEKVIPALKVEKALELEKYYISKGADPNQALERATKDANNLYGGLDTVGRSQAAKDIARITLFAPDYLESHMRVGKGVAEGLLNLKNPQGKMYRNIMMNYGISTILKAGLVAGATGGVAALTNHPTGHETDVPLGKVTGDVNNKGVPVTKDRYLRPEGNAADFARVPIEVAAVLMDKGLSAGDRDLKLRQIVDSRLSGPAKAAWHLGSDKDYYGNAIYGKGNWGKDVKDPVGNIVSELLRDLTPGFVSGGFDWAKGKAGAEEMAVKSLGTPPISYVTEQKPQPVKKSVKKSGHSYPGIF